MTESLLDMALTRLTTPRPLAEWNEDMGAVLWWCWKVERTNPDVNEPPEYASRWLGEPPYVGSPLDRGYRVEVEVRRHGRRPSISGYDVGGWPGYHTHFTPIPSIMPSPPK